MKSRSNALANFLDSIIEKYTATPRYDPESVAYSLRPSKKEPGNLDCEEDTGQIDGNRLEHWLKNLA